jgi:hypothetical protein
MLTDTTTVLTDSPLYCIDAVTPRAGRWRFGPAGQANRHAVEDFIASGFMKAYGARLNAFMPELMMLHDHKALAAACGLRPAAEAPLFLEQYLDQPAEKMLGQSTGKSIARRKIVEVGNLSILRPGYARHFVIHLTQHLRSIGMQWTLFSAVPALRNNFRRLGIPMITLAPADPARLASAVRAEWGSYYEQHPMVTAVNVDTAFNALRGMPCHP